MKFHYNLVGKKHIRSLIQQWFFEGRTASTKCQGALTPKLEEELRKSFEVGTTLQVCHLDELVLNVGIVLDIFIIDLIGNI